MLKKSLLLYFLLLSPLVASERKSILVDVEENDLTEMFHMSAPISIMSAPRQETGEEILARNKHKPELMSCSDWLKQERPKFSEENLSSHPLFPAVREAMALADFEVDVLIGFTLSMSSPSSQQIMSKLNHDERQGLQDGIVALRTNALRAKYFTSGVIDMVEGKVKIEDKLKEFFLSKLTSQVHEMAKLRHKSLSKPSHGTRQLVILNSKGKTEVLSPNDPDSVQTALNNAFLRSLNTQIKIMRIFLYHLKNNSDRPLIQGLPKDLSAILMLSPSLHPFLNKENDDWVNLNIGEARNFLGNAASLGIDLKDLLKKEKIQGVDVPKQYTKLSLLSLPKFLIEKPVQQTKTKKKKKAKAKAKAKTNQITALESPSSSALVTTSAGSASSVLGSTLASSSESTSMSSSSSALVLTSAGSSASVLGSSSASSSESSSTSPSSSSLVTTSVSSSSSVLGSTLASSSESSSKSSSSDVSLTALESPSSSALVTTSAGSASSLSKTSSQQKTFMKSDQNKKEEKEEKKKEIRRTDAHADTIYDIFRPRGYTSLNDSKIIAAWLHVMQGKGYHKKDTGRSHQPLYAELSDGSRVVLGLFRSSGYGPHYMRYIRKAFEAIGFGRIWLAGLGYDPDK